MTAFDLVRERLEEFGSKVKGDGRRLDAQCPAHDDTVASLTVTRASDRVLVRCHAGDAGCAIEDILDKLKLTKADLFDRPMETGERVSDDRQFQAVYDYTDENGLLIFQVCRKPLPGGKKTFPQRKPDGHGGWAWKLGDIRKPIFRLPRVAAAINNGEHIWVAEGEKDVLAIERAGGVATTNPHGAGNWLPAHAAALREAHVTVVADRDTKGRAHARLVADSLIGVAASVRIVEPQAGSDAFDHLAAGFTLADFTVTRDVADAGKPELAPDLHEFLAGTDEEIVWCIPGVLEAGDRFILTGPEGYGKSLLTYQMAVCAAAGIHPFRFDVRIAPQKVLLIDCENSERISRRRLRRLEKLATGAGRRVPDGGLRLIHRPAGVDLGGDDSLWLLERMVAHQPQLLVIGPMYRLHLADLGDEPAARAIVTSLDKARLSCGAALLCEAHSPHGETLRTRPIRPAGSSLFLRWPEMGYGLRPQGAGRDEFDQMHEFTLEYWRGPREDRPDMPRRLAWGEDPAGWPWIVT